MNMGLGFSEILLIAALVLILFGPKELPRMLREAARLFAKLKLYTDKIKRELDEAVKIDEPQPSYESESQQKKKALRVAFRSVLAALTAEEIEEKSNAVWQWFANTPEYREARSVMAYVNIGSEVITRLRIVEMLRGGKRVVIPYCKNTGNELGIAEIRDLEADVAEGAFGILEPVVQRRDNFFKSDLQLVICPAVAFDIYGGRLGRGKGYYDTFLKEIRGRVPIFGFAFDCQIHRQNLPFDYHDIPMDQIITETGLLLKKE